MQKHWYAVHTYSGHEDKVSKNILRRAESMGLLSKVIQVLVPKETETRKTRQGPRETKRKVFPGYVLVEMELDDQTWYLVKSTTGVTGFVSSGNKPVPLQDKEVQLILDTLKGTAPTPIVKFEKGEVVRVTSGPFTEFTGKIEEVNADKEKLRVLISIFGRDTPVELDFQQVEKVI
jgi:transcriptional antiterminator NusG